MTIKSDEEIFHELNRMDAEAADEYAKHADAFLLDLGDLNPDLCPPDRRFFKGNREAWVYEHGNIAELVFVKTD